MMKEFKKWKKAGCIKVCNLSGIGVCGDCQGIGTKEDTWKAALKWVLEITDETSFPQRQIIEKELRS